MGKSPAVDYNKMLPKARKMAWAGRRKFLTALAALEAANVQNARHTKGLSRCKLCKKMDVCGQGTYYSVKTPNGIIAWADNVMHYIKKHNVKPPEDFIAAVLATTNPPQQIVTAEDAKAWLDSAIKDREGTRYPIVMTLAQAKALRLLIK